MTLKLCATLFSIVLASAHTAWAKDEDLFRQSIAPVLQRRCLSCHNDDQRSGEFSLRTSQDSLENGFIEPGDAAASRFLEVLLPVNGKAAMPKNADPLTLEEIESIRQWIDSGAVWPADFILEVARVDDFDWWSYRPIERPAVPLVNHPWVRTPIDAWVLQQMNEVGLTPSEEADRRTLIRRVTYDLTGLPPSPEDVAAFVQDEDPLAYEQLVDRLLGSEHYGERWARHWLDVVKYADTCGYDKDKLRPNAWPYRDYVIRSFNSDKPYARFVQEQIAGDVLFPGASDGILGLGFIAAGPWDFIGHVEVPESKIDGKVARNLDRDEMVSNVMNTFCSVTVQCARCHNHKFDPVTQEQYYGLQAIFAAVDRAERVYEADPDVESRRTFLTSARQKLQLELAELDQSQKRAAGNRLEELNQRASALQSPELVRKVPEHGFHSDVSSTAEPDQEKWAEVQLPQPVRIQNVVLRPCYDDYASIGAGFGFPVQFRVEASADRKKWTVLADHSLYDLANPGLAPVTISGSEEPVRFIRVIAVKLALRVDDYFFALSEIELLDEDGKNVAIGAPVATHDTVEFGGVWSRRFLTDGIWPDLKETRLRRELTDCVAERSALLASVETSERIDRRKEIRSAINALNKDLDALPQGKLVYAAATQFPLQMNFKPTEGMLREIYVLHRGEIQQPLAAATPGVIPMQAGDHWKFDAGLPEGERRAALARWLVNDSHPLVWRSIVNRVWQRHFGVGLVATPNDFGRMGAAPTHPELLDWLACEFRDNGQSFKSLQRLIVTSSAYRQSSRIRPELAAVDGSHALLSRMGRRRLDAEEIRDSMLAASGVLNQQMGGPGFYLFELEKEEHSPHYEYHQFDPASPASHRRSIYRFVVRSQPDPWMSVLDCADSSQSTPIRNETLTSLQALSLLNNPFTLVMSEHFANRLRQERPTLPEQIDRAMQLIAQRPLSAWEQAELESYARLHGLPNLCRLLFNLSEMTYLD